MVAAAITFNSFFMAASGEIGVSRFLPARSHAQLIFGLARRAGIIFHAGSLLIAAYFAARLLSLCCVIGSIKANKHQHRWRKESHHGISPRR
jgi:formate hydrogenlyase subunit 3/multisubunit Na+/H+ antiporter MnhD subunit